MSFVNENIQSSVTFETSRGMRYADPLGRFGVSATTVVCTVEAAVTTEAPRLAPNVAEWDATLLARDTSTLTHETSEHI